MINSEDFNIAKKNVRYDFNIRKCISFIIIVIEYLEE